jgi:probable HAF family extracellular repeat protein
MNVLKQLGQPQTELDTPAVSCRNRRSLPYVKFALAVGMVACTFAINSVARAASFTRLGYLPNNGSSFASDISADGSTVVGSGDNQGFIWTQSTGMRALDFLSGANYGETTGVSADGTTVVGFNGYDTAPGEPTRFQGFRWTEATGTLGLGTIPGSDSSAAQGTSADGSIVVGELFGGNREGFRWTAAGMTGLGYLSDANLSGANFSRAATLSDNGQFIAGTSGINDTAGNIYAFEATRWNSTGDSESLGLLPDHIGSEAFGISADGSTVVGYSQDSNGLLEAFRWSQTTGVMDGLGRLTGSTFGSLAWDVSADGSTVVGYADDADRGYAFIWTPDNGLQTMQQILTDAGIDLTGWQLKSATGISNNGRKIVGYGTNPDGNTEAWLADLDGSPEAVPTPALLPGLFTIGWKSWRKRKHQAIA